MALGSSRTWLSNLLLCSAAVTALSTLTACPPKQLQPELPPKEVARISNVGDSAGERGDVVADAVQQGSNQARIQYDCSPPHSKSVEGRGVLAADLSKCELNREDNSLIISNQSYADCPLFLITINGFRGKGTYNSSSLGKLGFGTAKLRQAACKWDGSVCLDWNGTSGPHPEANCTVEISSSGGLEFGTTGATVSGTFVCSDFNSPYRGCPAAPATASCVISRASFSVAGCNAVGTPPSAKGKTPAGKKAKP
jgi:hypothetical protein